MICLRCIRGFLACLFGHALYSCSSFSWKDAIEEQLKLQLSVPFDSVYLEENVPVGLTLTNKGTRDIEFCIEEPIFHLMSPKEVQSDSIFVVDHHFCDRKTKLGVGEEISWNETVSIALKKPSRTLLHVAIGVVNPDRCGSQYGCEYTLVTNSTSMRVIEREYSGDSQR
jgi:hypothetical protein